MISSVRRIRFTRRWNSVGETMTTAFKTDKYELTMLQAMLKSGRAHQQAVFELFARKLPEGRRYGVVGGVERALKAVSDFRFDDEQIAALENDPVFDSDTVEYLKNYRFRGEVWSYDEGDVYFPFSPIMRVQGTFADSVILETVLLSILNHDSAVASAASRMVQAADNKPITEMGSRRTHDQAAVDSARAAYIAGFANTSNMEAGLTYGIPTSGTSAHAFTLAFPSEIEAFRAQVEALGVSTTLLVDTYDIAQGIRNAVAVAGTELGAIRIDSGDLHEETVNARKQLDELGAVNTRIVLSSDIDEYTISEMIARRTPVDGIGAGTRVVTGSGHPTAGMVFKLVERGEPETGEMIPVEKKASGKVSVGGMKRPYRVFDGSTLVDERFVIGDDPVPVEQTPENNPLHVRVTDGSVHYLSVENARYKHRRMMSALPAEAKTVAAGDPYITVTKKEN